MKKKVKSICDKTVYNYRMAKEELRYDGDYINHFAAIIYGSREEDIPIKKVKEIRSSFKKETSRISSFRGDILYIVSFLIALEDNVERFISDMINIYEKLRELEFRDSKYLVLASYSIVKYVKPEERFSKLIKMREIYGAIRREFKNVTNHEDYLECALLAIKDIDEGFITNFTKEIFNQYTGVENLSKNSIQALSMTIMLNDNKWACVDVKNLLLNLDKNEMRIGRQFLPLLGSSYNSKNTDEFITKIKEIIEYLCNEEAEYEFYMDKGFRFFIAMAIFEVSKNNKEERYIYELFSKGVYSSIVSKNQGIFDEVLA
jgi:hypothetical protein